MTDLKHMVDFNNRWGDPRSNDRIRSSARSNDVQKAECENYLKDMSLRFERAPNQATIKLWASDIIDAGYQEYMVRDVSRSVPFKFEKHPTLNQIMELLRPYLPQVNFVVDELTDLSHRCFPSIKAKFIQYSNQDVLTKMSLVYAKKVFPSALNFNDYYQEMVMLNDWLRTYFKKGEDIIEQGYLSNQAAERGDREYFLKHLRLYAKENSL